MRDSASVLLVRDGAAGTEVFLQRRVKAMAFAGGMTVFPGGGLDDGDRDPDVPWLGPEPAWWAERLGCDAGLARALVVAAVRETYEECGVLLASEPDGEPVLPAEAAEVRAALVNRDTGLPAALREAGLVLRADLLRPVSHWITPANQQRRYDTRFFLAALPAGQNADAATTEVTTALWQTPDAALAEFAAGTAVLMPPTWANIDVLRGRTVAELLAADPGPLPVICPVIEEGRGVLWPDAELYYAAGPARGRR